jgi:hypothetical protein
LRTRAGEHRSHAGVCRITAVGDPARRSHDDMGRVQGSQLPARARATRTGATADPRNVIPHATRAHERCVIVCNWGSAKAKTAPRGSKKGDWVYTNLILGAKMEILVNIRIGQVKRKTAESRGAFDSTERIILPRTHKRNHRGRKNLSWRTLLLWRSGPPLGAQFQLRKTAGL